MAAPQQQQPGSTASSNDEPIDIAALNSDKIKTLMRRDPRFITRLIAELDKQMHSKMAEKARRLEEVKSDGAALDKIDAAIDGHVRPCLDRLRGQIAQKQQLRERVAAQLEGDMQRFKDMEREAAALCSKVRHANSKLMSRTASAALQEARGFSATVPTSQLIRGSSSGGGGQGGGGGSKR